MLPQDTYNLVSGPHNIRGQRSEYSNFCKCLVSYGLGNFLGGCKVVEHNIYKLHPEQFVLPSSVRSQEKV